MECEPFKVATPKPSLLRQDEFSSRIISRKSSIGTSSRVHYYCRSGKGIPFKWEMQPGTPIHQPGQKEPIHIPPISPPPALLSLGLPKPSINIQQPKLSMLSRLKFWKYLHSKKHLSRRIRGTADDRKGWNPYIFSKHRSQGFLDFNDLESCRSDDGEFVTSSPPNSSSSSCSSSYSFTGHNPKDVSSEEISFKDSRSMLQGCTPWNVSNTRTFIRFYRKD